MEPEVTPMNDQLLDAAACDAVGALSAVESAAYQQDLAAAGDAARKSDRALRETAARLTAASPHMAPPPDLRGRILQATAPATFRMEDYRRKTREDYRFYKWGFYAAACFLVAAALYNIQTRGSLDKVTALNTSLNQQRQQLVTAVQQRNDVLAAFVKYPDQLRLKMANGQTVVLAVMDTQHHQALLFAPQEMIPPGAKPQVTLQGTPYQTVFVTAPAAQFGIDSPDLQKINIANLLNVKQTTPDENARPQTAGFHP